MEDLTALISSNPDPRILKRALAVKMSLQRYSLAQVADVLQTSRPFVSKWKSIYLNEGAAGLALGYTGMKPYLTSEQEKQVLTWLQQKNHWSLNELECYLLEEFDVEYASKQSYYDLFHEAGITFKKAQRSNPKKDPGAVELKKKELEELGKLWGPEVQNGDTVVLLEDECHVHHRDVQGYVGQFKDEVQQYLTPPRIGFVKYFV